MTPAPPVYFPGPRMSIAEISAARIDGELVPLGAGYVPADAPTPPLVRAASLAPVVPVGCALVGLAAAWVHGACDDLPHPIAVQRSPRAPATRVVDRRFRFHDRPLPPGDVLALAGCRLTTAARTLADLARAAAAASPGAQASRDAALVLARSARVRAAAEAWFRSHPRRAHAVAAVALIRSAGARAGRTDDQEDVTR